MLDMTNYRVVYKDRVYNVISIMPEIIYEDGLSRLGSITVMYLNEDNELKLMEGRPEQFKFIRR